MAPGRAKGRQGGPRVAKECQGIAGFLGLGFVCFAFGGFWERLARTILEEHILPFNSILPFGDICLAAKKPLSERRGTNVREPIFICVEQMCVEFGW